MPAGVFLSLDGLDGTGKSTQCRLLADRLRAAGAAVTTCVDPGGTDLGAKVRELLLFGRGHRMGARAEALLFMASRAELVDQVIRPALGRGEVVVSDRFVLANVVYQGHAGGLPPADVWQAGRFSSGGAEPDLTVVLDVPVDAAQARRGRAPDRMEGRARAFHEAVRAGFLAEAAARPDRIAVVDAGPPAEAVHAEVWRAAADVLLARGYRLPQG